MPKIKIDPVVSTVSGILGIAAFIVPDIELRVRIIIILLVVVFVLISLFKNMNREINELAAENKKLLEDLQFANANREALSKRLRERDNLLKHHSVVVESLRTAVDLVATSQRTDRFLKMREHFFSVYKQMIGGSDSDE